MLRQLEIENIALIKKNIITFESGLNVLTGETGAGKSVIINSLKLVLGGRASGEEINKDEERGMIQAIFVLSPQSEIRNKLNELDLIGDDELEIVLARELNKSGRNVCRINGRIVTLAILREIGELLVNIQGQHEQHSMFKDENYLSLLDSFGMPTFFDLLKEYSELFIAHNTIKRELSKLFNDNRNKLQRIDMIKYQIEEIDKADLTPNEEERLLQEKKILSNSEKIAKSSEKAYHDLTKGSNDQASALELLFKVVNELKEISKFDNSLNELLTLTENCTYQLEEVGRDIKSYGDDKIEFNPYRLDEIEDRLMLLKQLNRKYGSSVEAILEHRNNLEEELMMLENQEVTIDYLKLKLSDLEKDLVSKAKDITNARIDLAAEIEKLVTLELQELDMPKVRFQIKIFELDDFTGLGKDGVELLISPNLGQNLKPLAKIASGGELSRIFLALKIVLTKSDSISTLVFDEIDAGLGGQAVQVVAKKLDLLSDWKQVLCITHSPQIAGCADVHLLVYKEVIDECHQTFIEKLNPEQRVSELSRMLSGNIITDTTLQHAREILKTHF